MSHAVRFRHREDRRAAERALANPKATRYRWSPAGVGCCEHCRDGVVGLLLRGSRTEFRTDSFGRPMAARRIYSTARLCTAHAFLTEVPR
jgi:hypothetical protein